MIRVFNKLKPDSLNILRRSYSTTEASYVTAPYKLYKLENGPSNNVVFSKKDALIYYKQMFGIRKMETIISNLYNEKEIRGFCHLSSGQEACSVGIKTVVKENDTVITAYRNIHIFRSHGWTYLMRNNFYEVIAELLGKKGGCSRGKGGSMHMYGKNYFGGNGIVGAQVPLGAGLGFTHQYKNDGGVNFTNYGDGAANQGQVFEAFNMAKLLSLPCVFICENNGYGMGTSVNRSSANTNYYQRGDYIPGIWVDGMDILAVREVTNFAREFCRHGNGPIIIEAATYSIPHEETSGGIFQGHSMSDSGDAYRKREEVKEVRERNDPVYIFKDKILKSDLVKIEELNEIESSVKNEIANAVKDAKSGSEAGLEELSADIYSENLQGKIRGITVEDQLEHVNLGARINFK